MGARVLLPEGRIEATSGPGVRLESDEARESSLVRRLALHDASPLYPYVVDGVAWPKKGPWEAWLKPGYYVIEALRHGRTTVRQGGVFRYVAVTHDEARWVTEAKALEALGAVAALQAMGLDDAAVALSMGDLDAARVQWLRRRSGEG
jgi:hypothetical protein